MSNTTAKLRNWKRINLGDLVAYSGQIFGDIKERFEDGEWVRTSYVIEGPDESGVIVTRNSIYELDPPPTKGDRTDGSAERGGSPEP